MSSGGLIVVVGAANNRNRECRGHTDVMSPSQPEECKNEAFH